jgi:hypothetical protein
MILFAGTFVLSACALTEKQCTQGDWQGIGVKDGLNGRSNDYIANHIKACGKHDIAVNQSLWEKGRQVGLKTYCTPTSAYQTGRDGKSLKNVCPTANLSELQLAHAKGARYHDLTEDIRSLDRERDHLRSEIGRLSTSPISPENLGKIQRMRSEILQIDLRINHLQLQRKKYEYI